MTISLFEARGVRFELLSEEEIANILAAGRIFLKIIKRVALKATRIGMPNPVGIKSLSPFHSIWNRMAFIFWPEC